MVASPAMTTSHERLKDLTDKEKQALRLIVRGHDAKSMANELSLSVHTVNERLRIARRKLGVTSSREAARLLLGSEGQGPEIPGDRKIGDAATMGTSDADAAVPGKPARRHVAGALVMMTLIAAGLMALSQIVPSAPPRDASTAPATDAAVISAARDWLALGDAGNWRGGYETAGRSFREVNTVDGWASAAAQVRGPMGALVSREVRTVRYLNAPPHGYQEVAFATRYANRPDELIETVTLQREDGAWKVVGVMVE